MKRFCHALKNCRTLLCLLVSLLGLQSNPVWGEENTSHWRHELTPEIEFEFKDRASALMKAEIQAVAVDGFRYFSHMFGGLPIDVEGKPYRKLRLVVTHSHHSYGEADPGLIILGWNHEIVLGYGNWKTLLLHELFHLWNGESFRYQSQSEQWFNEGFSEYYAFVAATELGLITPEQTLNAAVAAVGLYTTALGRGQVKPSEAASSGKNKKKYYSLIYHGGWVMAMILDYQLRQHSSGQHNLDDVMVYLYRNVPRHQGRYQFADIHAALVSLKAGDTLKWLQTYLDGAQALPLPELLPLSQARWRWSFHRSPCDGFLELYQTLGLCRQNKG